MLTTISYSELRKTLKAALDRVCDTRAPLRITRRNGERVVLLPESGYEDLEETAYLLRSPANAKKLLKAMQTPVHGMVAFAGIDTLKREINI